MPGAFGGYVAPKVALKYRILSKGLGASMWFWMMYRIKEDGPVAFGLRHPWDHHGEHHEHKDYTAKDTTPLSKTLAAQLKTLHQKASRALILGQSASAWKHCNEAIEHCNLEQLTCEYGEQQARQLCCRLWILYICVLSSLAEISEEDNGKLRLKQSVREQIAEFPQSVRQVWDEIMKAFGGCAGNVDSEVLVPIVLLCLKLRDARTARDIVEAWLATLSDETMVLLQSEKCVISGDERQQQRSMAQASYLRVCELYTLHILPQLGDFMSAYDFLSVSLVVSGPAKSEFTRRLDSLRNPPAAKRRSSKRDKKPRKPKRTEIAPAAEAADRAGVHVVKDKAVPVAPETVAVQQPAKTAVVPAAPSTRSARPGKHAVRRAGVRSSAVAHRPRNVLSIAWQVVRRLMSQWGFTLFTLAIAVAVLRLVGQRFRLPQLLNTLYRKLWATIKMGTQVTYI
ncbi:hypothetical protein LPJ78_003168 [Coemansia sp. RSA 989]|nr:hypothetical protein LPJ78_003168 [Coemansia sp. RSA 989]